MAYYRVFGVEQNADLVTADKSTLRTQLAFSSHAIVDALGGKMFFNITPCLAGYKRYIVATAYRSYCPFLFSNFFSASLSPSLLRLMRVFTGGCATPRAAWPSGRFAVRRRLTSWTNAGMIDRLTMVSRLILAWSGGTNTRQTHRSFRKGCLRSITRAERRLTSSLMFLYCGFIPLLLELASLSLLC